jgi:hypothetical protein
MTRLPLLTRVAIETVLPSKAAKIESRLDALQTTFSDKNRMRQSAPSGLCGSYPAATMVSAGIINYQLSS